MSPRERREKDSRRSGSQLDRVSLIRDWGPPQDFKIKQRISGIDIENNPLEKNFCKATN